MNPTLTIDEVVQLLGQAEIDKAVLRKQIKQLQEQLASLQPPPPE